MADVERDNRESRPSIFLSHSSEDKEFVRTLAADLRDANVRAWEDEAEIRVGDSLIGRIESGIASSDYLGVVLSTSSVASEWVQREVRAALTEEIAGRRVKVLPLLIDDCEIPPFLADKLYLDFRRTDQYWAQLQRLIDRLGIAIQLLEPTPLRNLLVDAMEHVERLYELESDEAWSTGYKALDSLGVAFRPKTVMVVAGRPHQLVSAFSYTMALNAALRGKQTALSIGPFQEGPDFANQLLACEGRVSMRNLLAARLRDVDWGRLSAALGRLAEARWEFVDSRDLDFDGVDRLLRRARRLGTPVQLLTIERPLRATDAALPLNQNAFLERVGDIAGRYDVAVLVINPLPSAWDQKAAPVQKEIEPIAMAEEASFVILVSQDQADYGGFGDDVRVEIARNRFGDTGSIPIWYVPEYSRCGDIARNEKVSTDSTATLDEGGF